MNGEIDWAIEPRTNTRAYTESERETIANEPERLRVSVESARSFYGVSAPTMSQWRTRYGVAKGRTSKNRRDVPRRKEDFATRPIKPEDPSTLDECKQWIEVLKLQIIEAEEKVEELREHNRNEIRRLMAKGKEMMAEMADMFEDPEEFEESEISDEQQAEFDRQEAEEFEKQAEERRGEDRRKQRGTPRPKNQAKEA